MKLSEYIKTRLKELGMKRSDLVNEHGLDWSTLSGIDHDKKIWKVTQEKLARALQCSMGDIQACLAEQPDERRMVKIDPERAKMNELAREEEVTIMELPQPNPNYLTERWGQYVEPAETAEEYKQGLRDMFIKMAGNASFDTPFSDLTSSFGKAVLDQIIKEDP